MRARRLLKRPNRFSEGRQQGSAAQPQSVASAPQEGAAAATVPLQPQEGPAAIGALVPQVGAAGAAQPVSQPMVPQPLNKFGRGNAPQLILNRKSTKRGRAQGSQQSAAIAASLPQPGPAAGASQHEGAQPQPPMPNIRSSRSPANVWLHRAKEAATTNKVDLIFIETRLPFPGIIVANSPTVWVTSSKAIVISKNPRSSDNSRFKENSWPGPAVYHA